MVPTLWWWRGGCWWTWTAGSIGTRRGFCSGTLRHEKYIFSIPEILRREELHGVNSSSYCLELICSVSHSSRISNQLCQEMGTNICRWSIKSPKKKKPGFSSSGRRTNILSISSNGLWSVRTGILWKAWYLAHGIHLNKVGSQGLVGFCWRTVNQIYKASDNILGQGCNSVMKLC